MKNTKKILAVVLSVMLLISVMPFAAFAAEPPTATVTPLALADITNVATIDGKTITFDKGYKFVANDNAETVQQSAYKTYSADYVIKADRDLPAGSVTLGGQYNGNDAAWVTLTSAEAIPANTEVRLLQTLLGERVYTYEDICTLVKEFNCAIKTNDASVAGANITVELRIYETEQDAETGKYTEKEGAEPIAIDAVVYELETPKVAQIGDVRYASFEEALAAISTVSTAKHSKAVDPNYDYKTYVANGTIKLLADTTSNGIIIGSGSNLVVDFNGKTLDINEKPVGSNGTESIALQLLKNSDITFKNGTLTSSYTYSDTDTEYIQRLIQNYSNLTLDHMNVTMTGNFMDAITISTCNGDFVVKDSTVSAPDFSAVGYTPAMAAEQLGAEAFAFGTFSSYTAATATVQGNSTINGNVSVGVTNPDISTNTLTLTGGTLNGDIVMKDNADSEGVEITKANTFTQKAPEGYKWVDNGDGTSTIAEANYVAEANGVKYESFEEALAAISTVSTAKHSKAKDPNYDYKTYVANGTIKLLADTTSNGIIIGSGSNLVVDFNGKTLDINAKPVGSNGTESIALQLLKNSDITFKNGTLTSSYTYSETDKEYIQRLIQNYSNLTLDNMNVTMTGNFKNAITISTCNGDFVVNNSTVSAPDFSAFGYTTAMAAEQLGAEAFAFGTFSGYTAATATVQGNSTINGNVSVGVTNPDVSTNTLTLTGGTLNGDIVMKDNANSEGVEITKANTFTQKAPEGYKWVDNGDGTSTIAEANYVAEANGVKYESFDEALRAISTVNAKGQFLANGTVTLLADCTGNGYSIASGSNLIIDFNGNTYTVDSEPLAGSTGTKTQAFQLLKDSTVIFKNGTLYSEVAKMLVQNYSDLTLEGMTLTLENPNYYPSYTLSNNNGDTMIIDSTINANSKGGFAFDVCRYASYPSVSVTVTGDSEINGDVEIFASKGDPKEGLSLNLNGGTMSGDIVVDSTVAAIIENENVEVKKAADFVKKAPEGFEWDEDGILVPVVEPVNGGSLTLTDGIAFNAYLDADAYGVDASKAVVKLTYNAKSDINDRQAQVITETKALSEVEKYVDETSPYNGTYKFVFAQAPAQMNEDIVIELYANADETGPVASITTSAAELCEAVIASEETSQDYKDLCASLLDYGRAAQIYFEYDLANVAAAYNNDAVTTLGYADMRTTAASLNGIPFKGVSLTALSTTKWNILVTEAQTIDTVSGAATSATSEVLFDDNDAIVVNGVNAADFAKTFTVYTGSGSVTLSAAMIARAIVKASSDSQYQDLARAFYLYGCQAESFFA